MLVELKGVVKGQRVHALAETSLAFESGRATLGFAETEQRPTVLGLLAAGRMRAEEGEVLIDGAPDLALLRQKVALIDAPDVSAPEPNVTVASVVEEELMFAGRRAGPRAARQWLDEKGMSDVATRPVSNLDPLRRLRILCEMAVLRAGVEGLVVVSPDRHGGDPRGWWRLAEEFADRGFAMLMIAGEASRLVLADEIASAEPEAAR